MSALWDDGSGFYHVLREVPPRVGNRLLYSLRCDSSIAVFALDGVRPTLDATPVEKICRSCLEAYNAETDSKRTG